MKLLALSDTHGLLPELDVSSVDRILIAGDVCPVTNHSPKFQRRWLEQVFCPWVEALKHPVYLALGNHDFVADFPAPSNLHYGTERVVDDVLLFSWVPHFFVWAWMADEKEIAARLDNALGEKSPDIWVVHGPPYGACDEVGTKHCGSTALRKAIEKRQPRLVVCGHLHEGEAKGTIGASQVRNASICPDGRTFIKYRQGDAMVLNVSVLKDEYHPFRDPVVVDLS